MINRVFVAAELVEMLAEFGPVVQVRIVRAPDVMYRGAVWSAGYLELEARMCTACTAAHAGGHDPVAGPPSVQ